MILVRFVINLVLLVVYLLWEIIYQIARVFGSKAGIVITGVFAGIWMGTRHDNPVPVTAAIVANGICFVLNKAGLKAPGRPPFLRARARPVAPPKAVTAVSGRADDPDEAMMIGRLNPKLRELLRPRSDQA